MQHWLTTHYPHYDPVDDAQWYIYVPRGFEHLVCEYQKGDRVAFYEVQKGRERVGMGRKRSKGKQGVICIATASGSPRPTTFQERYTTGESTDFVLECPCSEWDFEHGLYRDQVCAALGLSESYNFHGFGGGAGFAAIDGKAFETLERAFLLATRD